jgi:outer membrane protein OmpA-like peptidoglycan-associated protein
MVDRSAVRADMQVLGSDGGAVGRVAAITGDRLRIKGSPAAGEEALYEVPAGWIVRVDDHVHLDRDADVVRDRWTGMEGRGARAAAASSAHAGAAGSGLPRGKNLLPWILIGIGILIALFLLVRGLGYALVPGPGTDQTHPAAEGASEAGVTRGGESAAVAGGNSVSGLQAYLASDQATPRTFEFDQLNFDTGSAEIRADRRQQVDEIGSVLAQRQNARVRVVGYADARGSDEANRELGVRRAETVAAALAERGVYRANIETSSGGDQDPRATNQTEEGRAENRRTELIVLSR